MGINEIQRQLEPHETNEDSLDSERLLETPETQRD